MISSEIECYKVVLIGDSGVGKSNILLRYHKNQFSLKSTTTLGVEFATKQFEVEQGVYAQIWDTSGQEKFKSLTKAYYRNAVGCVLVYDVSDYKSFESAQKWLNDIRQSAQNDLIIMLVGNKCDKDQRQVETQDAIQFSEKQNLGYIETSALSGLNIENLFNKLIQGIFEQRRNLQLSQKRI